MYRTINKKILALPASNQAVNRFVSITKNMDLTPKEAEQLSQYASDDSYVQKTKEDIRELTSIFRDKLGENEQDDQTMFLKALREHFEPTVGFRGMYKIVFDAKKLPMYIEIDQKDMACGYDYRERVDVEIQMTEETMNDIIHGRMTFQRGFMSGVMKMKGDFKLLRQLDQLFVFNKDRL